jgi:hypothetical protein
MPFDPRKITKEQIKAGTETLTLFKSIIQWVTLLAEMQSGKTGTFMFVVCEMLRTKQVNLAIIICGNSEKDLKRQLLKDIKEYMNKYTRYMRDELNISEDDRDDIITYILSRIIIKSGADLDPKHDDKLTKIKNTLIIWEESHFASSKTNRPNKFIERMGLKADGDPSCLEAAKNNYVLTVSATSFAEIADIHHEHQHKEIVRLNPGEGYRGVGYYLRNKKIIGFGSWKKDLSACLKKYADNNKYGIVRVNTDVNMDDAKKIANDNGWAFKVFDAEHVALAKKTHDHSAILSLDELETEPLQKTLLLIRGMCRMGKVVPKVHIAFVMETSALPNTDTLLQGLVGRMCGYHTFDVDIYVPRKMLTKKTGQNTTELEKYINLMEHDNIRSIPNRAAHLIGVREVAYDTYPIIITGFNEDRDDPDYAEFNSERITRYVKSIDLTGSSVININKKNHTDDIIRQLTDSNTNVVIHRLEKPNKRINTTYTKVPEKFAGILSDSEPLNAVRSEPGCGLNSNGVEQINVWAFNTNAFSALGFPLGTLIIQAASKFSEDGPQDTIVPNTTGKEAFTSKHEDDTEVIGNGTCALSLSRETSTSVDAMKKSIKELVHMSLQHREVIMARCITSNQDANGDWQGIMVNEAVHKALQKGGVIFNYINTTFNLKIKTVGQRGPSTKACRDSGLKRLCKIEW